MAKSLQVLYPTAEGTTFDFDYYLQKHFKLVEKHLGTHIDSTSVTKGVAGGPEQPPGFYAVATMTFADDAALGAALEAAGPVLADIPNFTDSQPQMLIGDVLA